MAGPDPGAGWSRPRLRVTVAGGCPASHAGIVGVTSVGEDLEDRLVPSAAPQAGLVCRYAGSNAAFRPVQTRRQDAVAARRLAAAVARLGLSHVVGGATNCPSDDGAATVVALSYPGRGDVDLWFPGGGCPMVSNGCISAVGRVPGLPKPALLARARLRHLPMGGRLDLVRQHLVREALRLGSAPTPP